MGGLVATGVGGVLADVTSAEPSHPGAVSCPATELVVQQHITPAADAPSGPASGRQALESYLTQTFPGLAGKTKDKAKHTDTEDFAYESGGVTKVVATAHHHRSFWYVSELTGCEGTLRAARGGAR